MSFSNDLPFFYRATNPNVAHIKQVTSKLYQWDGTSSKPLEVIEGRSAAGPLNVNTPGTATIWSDTYTLGYTNENEASPIFFEVSDKPSLLKAINAVAKRLGVSIFSNIIDAKGWALSESRIYLNDNTLEYCDPIERYQFSGGTDPNFNSNPWGRIWALPNSIITSFYPNPVSNIPNFENEDLTKTKGCHFDFMKEVAIWSRNNNDSGIVGSKFASSSRGTMIFTSSQVNSNGYYSPEVGDVIYRTHTGHPNYYGLEYFGSGGFIFHSRFRPNLDDLSYYYWIVVGSNGVVVEVQQLSDQLLGITS